MSNNIPTLTAALDNINLSQLRAELNNLPTKEAQASAWSTERSDLTLRYWRG